jgi:hypothetical protein
MRRLLILVLCAGICPPVFSQEVKKARLYDPADNAQSSITRITKEARSAGKHVLIQVGNNGCVWCYRFHDFITKDKQIDSVMNSGYIIYHLNTSPENTNEKLLARYRYPQRFGYPVFLVLNGKGELIHTQNSVYLEAGVGYNREKVLEFINQWSPSALDPSHYKPQQ